MTILGALKVAARWFAAMMVAALVYLLIWTVVALVWKNVGGNAQNAYTISVLLSSAVAVFVGSSIVPRHQWKLAFCILAALASLGPIWFFAQASIAGNLKPLNIIDVGFTFIGSFIAYQALRAGLTGRRIRRVKSE